MKRFYMTTVSAGLALALMAAPMAMAQYSPSHNDDTHGAQPGQPHDNNAPQHPTSGWQAPQHPAQDSHMAIQHQPGPEQHDTIGVPNHQEAYSHNDHYSGRPDEHSEAYPDHHWQHGEHYNGDRHVVSNWSRYHLRRPPSGYEWVQDGSQFVLIAAASGIIAEVIANAG